MLKCGQKGNSKYVFGIKKDEEPKRKYCCSNCDKSFEIKANYCPFCGEKNENN